MTTTSAIAAEGVLRVWMDNDATGAPIRVKADGSTDGAVAVAWGRGKTSGALRSDVGANISETGAIDTDCFKRTASQSIANPTPTLFDCPNMGAGELFGKILGRSGFKPQYNAGSQVALGLQSASSANCVSDDWTGGAAGAANGWTVFDLYGHRYTDDSPELVRANIFRNVRSFTQQQAFQYGLADPGAATTDLQMDCSEAGAGWAGSALGLLFPAFDDIGDTVATTDPVSLNYEVASAMYQDIVQVCDSKSIYRMVPLTAAMFLAEPRLQSTLIYEP